MADDSLRAWMESNLERLYRLAFVLAQDREQARDLVHESVVRALAASRWPGEEAAYRTWLFAILRNTFIDRHRKRRNELATDEADSFADDSAEGWHGDHRIVDVVTVRLALARLSLDHREVIGLVDIAGFSYAETAAVLDIAEGTVMSRLSRARKALLAVMSEVNVTSLERARRSAR